MPNLQLDWQAVTPIERALLRCCLANLLLVSPTAVQPYCSSPLPTYLRRNSRCNCLPAARGHVRQGPHFWHQ